MFSRTGDDEDGDLASEIVSTGFALLLGVAGLGIVMWLVVRDLVDLPDFLGIPSSASSESLTALGVLVGILLLNLPLERRERRNGDSKGDTSPVCGRQLEP